VPLSKCIDGNRLNLSTTNTLHDLRRFPATADAEYFVANENVYFELWGKLFVLAGLYSFPLRNAGKYFVNDALI
jgi:hypothetical protein